MKHVETLTKYVTHFVDQLIYSGVKNVVISPGSRSTPLAMTFAEHPDIKHWINLDERSAAFFALGVAKEQQQPVALVCTSGTAAANYYPAIVEAHYSRVPLIVLTSDRPHELRDVGAPQSIDQTNMFGTYVNWYQDLALPESVTHQYARRQAARSVEESVANNQGPVHLNLPFREPLIPDFSLGGLWREGVKPIPRVNTGVPALLDEQITSVFERISKYQQGVIVCGPQMDPNLSEHLTLLASKLGVPILADPLSQLRSGEHDKRNLIENYDSLLKSDAIKEVLQPDFILRFGAMPISKAYLKWIQKWDTQIDHFVVDSYASYREPSGVTTQFIWAEPSLFCQQLAESMAEGSSETKWLEKWQDMNTIAKNHMLAEPDEPLNEGHAVVYLSESLPAESNLFIGNSMPIRDVDSFFMSTPKTVKMLANRGANGIDGVVSTAIGAAVSGRPTTLLLGDLSFFHDLNGLLVAKQQNISLTIVVINNDGGGIFSYLPQAEHTKHYEELFGTPLGLDFQSVIEMYGGVHRRVQSWQDYKAALHQSDQYSGLFVVEVITSRNDHVAFHKDRWQSIEEALLNWGGE